MTTSDDNEKDILLWSHFKNGDAESFVSIFRNYYSNLFNYGYKITTDVNLIEDCIQELFIDLWRSNGKADILSLKGYLFSALKFKLIKAVTKSGHTNSYTSEVHETAFEISREMLLINDEENKELNQKVFNAIEELSPRQKEIIYLKFNQDFSYNQISQIMHISYQAARNLLYQSIKILKKIVAS
jgi:RNA polymerase sigma-70 factor (ECF subfamily)